MSTTQNRDIVLYDVEVAKDGALDSVAAAFGVTRHLQDDENDTETDAELRERIRINMRVYNNLPDIDTGPDFDPNFIKDLREL